MTTLLISLMLACAVWAVTAGILIVRDLQKRGFSVDYLLLRMKIFYYLEQYRKITREETGRVGPLFYHYVIPWIVALVLAIILIVYIFELG